MTDYRTHIIIGETIDAKPVAIPRLAVDDKYWSIRGGVGAGKTVTLANLASQLIEPYLRDGQPCRDPVVIVDLGADLFFYHAFAKACEDNGVRLWTISLDPRRSHHFDPTQSLAALGANPAELANFLAAALNLVFSEEYGKGFWGAVNVNDLIEAFSALRDRGIAAPSLHQVAQELNDMNRRRRSTNLSQAVYACNLLLQFSQLKATGDPDKDCSIKSVLENCEAIFCSLDAIRQASAARALGSLVSRSLLIEADIRKESQPPRYPRLIQDEAPQLISKANADAFFLGRKHISMAISYQSSDQWLSRDGDLRGALRDNCAYKLYFGASTDNDVKELQGYSRETTAILGGSSISGQLRSATTSSREYLTRTLTVNQILDITWTRWMGFFVQQDGSGHQDPIKILCRPRHPKELHDKWRNTPLPIFWPASQNEQQRVPPSRRHSTPASPKRTAPLGHPPTPPDDPEAKRQRQLLAELLATRQAAEAWE